MAARSGHVALDTTPRTGNGTAAIEGPAFTRSAKVLATALMLALMGWGLRSAGLIASRPWSIPAVLAMTIAIAAMVLCYGWILRSRTCIDPTHLHQTWFAPKRVALAEITRLKLIYVPGLAWLIAPRLVVRTRQPGSTVFHAGDPRVLEALVRLAVGQPHMP